MSARIRSIVLPRDPNHEFVRVMTHATVEKRTEDDDNALGLYLARGASWFEAETRATQGIRPYEVLVGDYNAMVDNGIDLALLLLVGGGGTAFNNANARLGVGDSATASATTQTDLVAATNKLRKGMNATYPVTGTKKSWRARQDSSARMPCISGSRSTALARRRSRERAPPGLSGVRSESARRQPSPGYPMTWISTSSAL